MTTAFVYHFFSQFYTKLIDVQHSPIIHSIASLRKHSNVPIYVIDHTPELHDWEGYCNSLNFQIIPFSCCLNIDSSPGRNFFNAKYFLQKVLDIKFFFKNHDCIVYCDSDIFWLDDPFPLTEGNFCTTFTPSGLYNSGYYYFRNLDFLDHWVDIIEQAIRSKLFRKKIFKFLTETKTHSFPNILTDETTMTFAAHHFSSNLNLQKEVIIYDNKKSTKEIKGIHFVSRFIKNKKSLFQHLEAGGSIDTWEDFSKRNYYYLPDSVYKPFREML